MPKLRYSKVRDVKSPVRGTEGSAGIDFFVPNDFESVVLQPNESVKILSGIHVQVPSGYALQLVNKSGVALKGLSTGACLIDEDFMGQMSLHLFNHSTEAIKIEAGMKIVQGILLNVGYHQPQEVPFENLYPEVTERGEGGFGSTGTH